MKNTRKMAESDVELLRVGDKLLLDVIAGASVYGQDRTTVAKHLQSHGLNHGETYAFAGKKPIYKSGEGSIVSWYIDVKEQAGDPKVPFYFYAVTPDLEARLAERK